MKTETQTYPDVCICCGEPVPEGSMVCHACETESNIIAPSKPIRPQKGIRKILGLKKENIDEPRD